MRSNIIPPEALQEAIIAKTKSVQQAEASKQQAIAAKADGERKIAVAKADSAETIINASAQAKTISLKQQQLTPLYIEFKKIEKWDGRTPTTVLSNGGSTLFNILSYPNSIVFAILCAIEYDSSLFICIN
jgi:regulator of protease activity HflC (stomatin/prohibitin superfamily)